MIRVTTEHKEGEALKQEVDEDIAAFDTWFQSLQNDPLVPVEKAIISTYMYWKTQVQSKQAEGG